MKTRHCYCLPILRIKNYTKTFSKLLFVYAPKNSLAKPTINQQLHCRPKKEKSKAGGLKIAIVIII